MEPIIPLHREPTTYVETARIGDHIALLTLKRPLSRNAVNAEMADEIHAFVSLFESTPQWRVGILTGLGPVFCAGSDLKEIVAGRDVRIPRPGGFAGFVNRVSHKPWIAALNGSAYGGGTEMALACDLVVMADDAVLCLPEVRRGLFPSGGAAIRLPRLLPPAIANEVLLTGDPLSAKRAYDLGLVNCLAPQNQVLETAVLLASKIATASPGAIGACLKLGRETLDYTLAEMWKRNQQQLVTIMASDDAREGPRAFVEKRPPTWTAS